MDRYTRRIEADLGDPVVSPPEIDWDRVQEVVGRELPDDYLHIYRKYGGVITSDSFLEVVYHFGFTDHDVRYVIEEGLYSPRSLAKNFDSFYFYVDGETEKRDSSFAFDSDPFSALLIGDTQNGDNIFLYYDKPTAKWTPAVANGADWWQYRMSFSEFLVRVLDGEMPPEVFPEDWPESDTRLMQYDDATGGPVVSS